ncbi:MAG: alpha/beta fold hydrolase [Parcubacteria group bacterium]|nr:alpha/beta fold hydrolase [Parcubacteria group bacterium]
MKTIYFIAAYIALLGAFVWMLGLLFGIEWVDIARSRFAFLQFLIERNYSIVQFRTKDGVRIAGTFYKPELINSPAVILAHQLGKTRRSMSPIARFLQKNGFAVLAIDLRGHGESIEKDGSPLYYYRFKEDDFKKMTDDLEAAYVFLSQDVFVDKNKISVIGAGLGANVAYQFATFNEKVKSAILISPAVNYRGVKTLDLGKDYDSGRLLGIIIAKDDWYYPGAAQFAQIIRTVYKKIVIVDRGGSGMDVLDENKELYDKLLEWLKDRK